MAKRVGLSKKTRFEVFKRDAFTCQYCGSHPPTVILHVDHIIAVIEGGKNDMDNLITACEACNQGKGRRALSAIPVALSERAASIAEKEEQIRGYAEIALAKRARIEDQAWDVAEMFMDHFNTDKIRLDSIKSIKHFVDKLGVVDVMESMDVATAQGPRSEWGLFKYFCAICWRKIREIEE